MSATTGSAPGSPCSTRRSSPSLWSMRGGCACPGGSPRPTCAAARGSPAQALRGTTASGGEAERRVLVGDQGQRVADHTVVPTEYADHEIENAPRIGTGEQNREPGNDHREERPDVEEGQDYVVRDRQQPLDQRKPPVQPGGIRIG